MKCRYYCRYVDDFIIFYENPEQLNEWSTQINKFLKENLHQHLHPCKKLVNKLFAGIDFVGFVVKPNRILLRQSTLKRSYSTIKKWKKSKDFEKNSLVKFFKTMNSYLGMLSSIDGYMLRKDLCLSVVSLFLSCDIEFKKLKLVKNLIYN